MANPVIIQTEIFTRDSQCPCSVFPKGSSHERRFRCRQEHRGMESQEAHQEPRNGPRVVLPTHFLKGLYMLTVLRNGTSMISLIIPPKDQIPRVQKLLAEEYGTASNIKSRVNRLSVLGAITSTQQRLKLYNRVPPNGLVVFCGYPPSFNGSNISAKSSQMRANNANSTSTSNPSNPSTRPSTSATINSTPKRSANF